MEAERYRNKVLGKRQIKRPQRFEPEEVITRNYESEQIKNTNVIRLKNIVDKSEDIVDQNKGVTVKIVTKFESPNRVVNE